MPGKKWTQTRSEQVEYQKHLARLRAAGADVVLPSSEPVKEWMNIRANSAESCVRVLPIGVTLYIVHTRIVVEAANTVISSVDFLSRDGEDLEAYLKSPTGSKYCIGNGQFYDQEEVLNHLIEEEKKLYRGQIYDGFLIAESLCPLPASFAHGMSFPLCLSFGNQFDDCQELNLDLRVVRAKRREVFDPSQRSGLLGPNQLLPRPEDTKVLNAKSPKQPPNDRTTVTICTDELIDNRMRVSADETSEPS